MEQNHLLPLFWGRSLNQHIYHSFSFSIAIFRWLSFYLMNSFLFSPYSSVPRISESPASVTLTTETRKYLPQAVPKSHLFLDNGLSLPLLIENSIQFLLSH